MNEHDARIMAPKIHSVPEGPDRVEWGRKRTWCYACGAGEYGVHVLTTHEIVGGRGGRSQEPCNWLRLGMHPCHDLATGHDIRSFIEKINNGHLLTVPGGLLPKLTLAIQLTLKQLRDPEEWTEMRLTVLHGRRLPAAEPIPEFFRQLFKRNRPEL